MEITKRDTLAILEAVIANGAEGLFLEGCREVLDFLDLLIDQEDEDIDEEIITAADALRLHVEQRDEP